MPEKPSNYFEGILQLRNCTDEVIDWTRDEIVREGKARIAKVKEVPGGIDLYLSSQRYLQTLGRKLQKRFGGIFRIARKTHTRDSITSRNVYRVTVMFRQLKFNKGDTIVFQGEKWEVQSVGAQVGLKNIQSGQKKRVPAEKLAK